ncbi:probable serine/threonine-protein kinase WNK4 [Beta vulgaris subsp. vulgaris]|uniref:probable serine/threonine-protein kinase WNK4 n=1 Tax=Beta vulgaris subsp. vulgaris TaxID=3555 RepID=UPI00203713D3|nr:probable serine/threonine-protein kinase WNK4 [Beta vulgaris subsp. vulgaris]
MGSSLQEDDIEEFEVVEKDPTGRYVRYEEVLGEGEFKTVYKGFDEVNGLEIAWSKVELTDKIFKSQKHLENVCSEANLLKSLNHENIMICYYSWVDNEKKTVNMITELFTSGNMSQYRKKYNRVDTKAIKNWARQILKGLDYLHCHSPPIIHRDIKCDNIFINGNSGKVKIGDLGLAAMLQQGTTTRAAGGTPAFMAPEFYDDEYDQLVDIYSFGMCLLQMVTRELPYSECTNSGQLYKKVSSGVKPAALGKVTDLQVKQFIEKCLSPASERPSAIDLLNDPFLASSYSGSSIASSKTLSLTSESVCSSSGKLEVASSLPSLSAAAPVEIAKAVVSKDKFLKLEGKVLKENDSVSMTLRSFDVGGHTEKIEFIFFIETDTCQSVMEEMVKELELSVEDAALITGIMERVVTEIVRGYSKLEKSPKSPQVHAQNTTGEDHDLVLQGDFKCKGANGIEDYHPIMPGISSDALKICINKQDTEAMRIDERKCSKVVAKARSRSRLRKLLFLCRNRF